MFFAELAALGSLAAVYPELFRKLAATYGAGLLGGRIAAITAGLKAGFSPYVLSAAIFIFNSIWLCVFYPLVTSFYENVLEKGVMRSLIRAPGMMAEKQKEKIIRYGMPGLFVFVWLPLPWTGALVGSVIGYLLGVPMIKIIMVVMPAMLAGIVSWTAGFNYLFGFINMLGGNLSKAAVALIIAGAVFLKYFGRARKGGGEAETGETGT